MNGMRKWLGVTIAAALLPLAVPATAAAPQKVYDLAVCVGAFDADDPLHRACDVDQAQVINNPTQQTPIQARIYNLSPPNTNSSINSIDLFALVNWHALSGTVQILDNANATKAGISAIGAHLKISNLAPIKPGGFVTIQFNVDSFSCGFARWDVTAYTGSSFSGATFAPSPDYARPGTDVACGQFTCNSVTNDIRPQGDVAPTSPGYISSLKRGNYNTNGITTPACSTLYAYVTPTITATSAQLQTLWDKNLFDSDVAVFRYTFNLLNPTNSTDATAMRNALQVAWKLKTDLTPDFQPALNCEAHVYSVGGNPIPGDLPAPIASLVADNGSKIDISGPTGVPLDVPFSIVIEDEMMVVTKVITNTNTWFVTRGVGGTAQTLHVNPSPTASLPVMSNPFPLVKATDPYPSGYVGLPARVCIRDFVQSMVDLTQFSAIVIDGSDGWVRIGQ